MTRPNVLFIAIDDLNAWLGCLGVNPDVRTPHMDRLASRGMLFRNACCAAPVCNPSRTAVLHGLQPTTTGCYLLNDELIDSPQRERTLPLPIYFQRQGYHTMRAGKIDHGTNPVTKAAAARGLEPLWNDDGGFFNGQNFGLLSPGSSNLRDCQGAHPHSLHWGPLDEADAAQLSDSMVADWAVERLHREYEQPFFLATGFFRPHTPLIAPRRFFELYDPEQIHLPDTGPEAMPGLPAMARNACLAGWQDLVGGSHAEITDHGLNRDIVHAYLACISFVDDCIGRVLDALEASPYAENTMVVLWSDNGWGLGEHFHWLKWSTFDIAARVPLIIRAPGLTAPGSVCEAGVCLTDLYPTLLDCCDLPPEPLCEGSSLRPLLAGETSTRAEPARTSFGPAVHSLRDERWRYVHHGDGSEELYDHRSDASEFVNLADNPELEPVLVGFRRWLPDNPAPALASVPPPAGRMDLTPGQEVWFRGCQSGYAERGLRISAEISLEQADAIVLRHGGAFAGYCLYLRAAHLHFAVMDPPTPLHWRHLTPRRSLIRDNRCLPPGTHRVVAQWRADGELLLSLDDQMVARGRHHGPLSIYPTGLLEAGQWLGPKGDSTWPAIGLEQPCAAFPGSLQELRVEHGIA